MSAFIRKVKTPENFVPWTESQFRRHMLWESLKYQFPFYHIKNCYYFLRDCLSPRQKWLTKDIPNYWSDKPVLIPQLLIKCLIHFVEEEKCFANTDYNVYTDDGEDTGKLNQFAEELLAHYKIAKNTLPELRAQIEKEFVKVSDQSPGAKTVDELYNLEDDYDELESLLLVWIVENRNQLWT